MAMFELLLPDSDRMSVVSVSFADGNQRIVLELETTACDSACPLCHQKTTRVHSWYRRYLADLPWAGIPVALWLKVRRFFCCNAHCARVIFCERLPGVATAWARRTGRLAEALRRIGLALGGAAGARLAAALKMKAGIDLILTLIRRGRPTKTPLPRVLGVDDWALRKGQRYGTILVDLERSEIVDLLADRSAETLTAWLQVHPGVEIVTRDRSQTYADAIKAGAPAAIQVADRWHLLKNLTELVFKILQQEHSFIQKRLVSTAKQCAGDMVLSEAVLSAGSDRLTASQQRHKAAIALARQLHRQGWTQKAIAYHLSLHPKTIRRYLQASMPEVTRRRKKHLLLTPYKDYLLKRWNEGCHNATQLFREIQPLGYPGEVTIVRDYARQLRRASGLPPGVRSRDGRHLASDPTERAPSLRTLAWFIVQQPTRCTVEAERLLARLSADHPKLAMTIRLARAFVAMVRQRQPEQLDAWLIQASESGFRNWQHFAAGLRQDEAAVRAALTHTWSNGPTEGHVNRLKAMKRAMYGRANLDLLRLRLVEA
jgi:transposase